MIITAGPVWDQIVEFVKQLPQLWDELTSKPGFQSWHRHADADETIKKGLQELAKGLPDAANALLGFAGSVFGSVLELVTLTFLVAVPADGAPADHGLAVRLHAAGESSAAGARWSRTRSPRCRPR